MSQETGAVAGAPEGAALERPIRPLDPVELRVLGALLEKEQATPDHYPLTVAALIAACNQKSNRDPVTRLTETEVVEALDRLRADVLAWRSEGARAERWSQAVSRRLELDPAGKAIVTVLLLRGPQTPGELRARTGRLHPFDDLAEVEAALRALAGRAAPLVEELPRRPGQKESRWRHLLGAEAPAGEAPPAETDSPRPAGGDLARRVEALERRVSELERRLGGSPGESR